MRRRDTIIKGARAVWRILDPRHWPAPLLAGLRACGCTVAYAAALLLSLVWLSSALATLKSPLLDLGKPHVGDAIIAFSHHLSLSPIGIFMLAHLLVALKLVLGTLLLLGVGEGIHGRLRGSPGSRDILDLALFVSAIGSIVAAFPVLAETNGLHEIIGELMLCVIASALAGVTPPRHEPAENRATYAAVENFGGVSLPGSFRPATSFLWNRRKTWVPGTRPGRTPESIPPCSGPARPGSQTLP